MGRIMNQGLLILEGREMHTELYRGYCIDIQAIRDGLRTKSACGLIFFTCGFQKIIILPCF